MLQRDLDNDSKPWDPNHNQLFHRINSENFDKEKNRDPADGKGYECGCKSPQEDFLPSGLSDVLANGLVKAIDSALTGALASIPFVGPALVAFRNAAEAVYKNQTGKSFDEALADLIASGVEGALFGEFIKSIPAWAPVDRKKYSSEFKNKEGKEVEREVEGILTNSYENIRDIPFFQWSHWYHWSFQVSPIRGYAYMVGEGNIQDESEQRDLDNPPHELFGDSRILLTDATDVNLVVRANGDPHSMECLMDVGAFSKTPGSFGPDPRSHRQEDHLPGVMFHPGWPFWPMTGDYFWATGRWVYDCRHTTSLEKTGAEAGLMPTQLNPCKAFAVARYEAFKFDDNEKFVPAVRFLFFACRMGGYINFGDKGDSGEKEDTCAVKFNDKDYEFVLDLPEAPIAGGVAWPIGHTPDFPMNTVVLRPRLLKKVQFAPFDVPSGLSSVSFPDFFQFEKSVQPEIDLVRSQDSKTRAPDQVKVKIPLSQVDGSKHAYGVCISLGWFDPAGALAQKVRKVTVGFNSVHFTHGDHQSGKLQFHLGVNGRWLFAPLQDVSNRPVSLAGSNSNLTLMLPDDAFVKVTSHGRKRHGFGEYMDLNSDNDRKLNVGGIFRTPEALRKALEQSGDVLTDIADQTISSEFVRQLAKEAKDLLTGQRREVQWKKDVDQEKKAVASAVAREMFTTLPAIFNRQNDALGLNQTLRMMKNLVANLKSPDEAEDILDQVDRADVIGDATKLARHLEGVTRQDYELRYQIKVAPQ